MLIKVVIYLFQRFNNIDTVFVHPSRKCHLICSNNLTIYYLKQDQIHERKRTIGLVTALLMYFVQQRRKYRQFISSFSVGWTIPFIKACLFGSLLILVSYCLLSITRLLAEPESIYVIFWWTFVNKCCLFVC